MAFELRENNLTGISVIDAPAGVIPSHATFIDKYDYVQQYQPELVPELFYSNGLGKITDFLRVVAGEGTYESDMIQHMELGRLHNVIHNVTVAGEQFTAPTPHNLRVNMVVKISDGVATEAQAIVTAIISPTVFEAKSDSVAFNFTSTVTVLVDFSNRWDKGTSTFGIGRNWNPKPYYNYSQIIKETYNINESDMVHTSWVMTPFGPRWYNAEMERTGTLFRNLEELTAIFHERALENAPSTLAGFPRGMNGVVPTIENFGNISNEYISEVGDLSDMALRLKQQGNCREVTMWCDHGQMRKFRELASGVNASFVNGANYGMFSNSKDMALKLDFASILVEGVTFHFTAYRLLDDPTLMGATKFNTTSLAYLGIPSGLNHTMEGGKVSEKPYLSLLYRSDNTISRKRKVQIFGFGGVPQKEDVMTAEYLSEMTNKMVGTNSFFVGRKNKFYI